MRNYVSLIMDIEKSRTYANEDRMELQEYISECVHNLNDLFRKDIEYSVTFSAGDELQGLFNDTTAAVLYFRLFEMLLKPVKLRAGIGVGELTIKIDDGLSTQQDGPAYHKARYAIENVYRNPFQNVKIYSEWYDNMTDVRADVMANHLINASRTMKNQQIYMQNIVLVMLELLCPFIKREKDIYGYDIIWDLLKNKFKYKIGKPRRVSLRNETLYNEGILHFSHNPIIKPIYIDGRIEEAEGHIVIKNVSLAISEILGCSRQNVDSILRRGNANKIRELDYMALQYIERMYRD